MGRFHLMETSHCGLSTWTELVFNPEVEEDLESQNYFS